MHRRILFALLLALLLEPAAATSPAVDFGLPTAPMEPLYAEQDGILNSICIFCGVYLNNCVCALANTPHRAPTFTAETFTHHPQWPRDGPLVFESSPEPDRVEPELRGSPTPGFESVPLTRSNVEQLNSNATRVLPSTVQAYIDDTYLPGDRTQKRQNPQPGGFPCKVEGCGRVFDRNCELTRHRKKHLSPSERPHMCSVPDCGRGFLYPKDLERHQARHRQLASIACSFPGCRSVFGRRDNLLRHQRKKHPDLVPAL